MDKSAAIKYNDGYPAPFVIAKGKGALAKRIREIAIENNVEIVQSSDIIDNLIELDAGSFIPENLYEIIAEILNFVYRIKDSDEKF